jgi:amino acid adenylation domain-containing protein
MSLPSPEEDGSSDGGLVTLFERRVDCFPNAVAVESAGRIYTYSDLDKEANGIADVLLARGIAPGDRVAIAARRSVEALSGILATLKAGAAYVPVDPTDPFAYLDFVIRDTDTRVLLAHDSYTDQLAAHDVPILTFARELADISQTDRPGIHPASGDLAYVMYTSGSTGRPKGVMIEHRHVIRRVRGAAELMPRSGEGMLQTSRLDFDAQTWEVWGALASGARLVVVPAGDPVPAHVAKLIRERDIGVALLSPGLFRQMVETHLPELGSLRLLLVGGDVLSPSHARRFVETHPGRPLVNLYGPTEVTVCGSAYEVGLLPKGESVPIGGALGNTQLYLLDNRGRPVEGGATGEVFIGGGCVARGYLNLPEATEERFVPDPFSEDLGARMYKTGDQAKLRSDGELEFIGRSDDQVKIRGFRIEPAEVESIINLGPGVIETIVIPREDVPGHRRLVAYVVLAREDASRLQEVRQFVAAHLPSHMVPSSFVELEQLPRTVRGKIDRASLPAPDALRSERPMARTATEREIARIWEEVLHVSGVGIDENFLELGGDSLLAIRVLVTLQEDLDVVLPLDAVFDAGTVEMLAQRVESAQRDHQRDGRPPPLLRLPIQRGPRQGGVPITATQAQALLISELAEEALPYQFQALLHFEGHLVVSVLEDSLSELMIRHDLLHTRFVRRGTTWQQVITSPVRAKLPITDLRGANDQEESLATICRELFSERIAVDVLPLMHWRLVRLADDHHVLVHVEHHVIHDGWSWSVFLRELAAIYQARIDGHQAALVPLELQFADFASWQSELVASAFGAQQLDYWRRQLAFLPPPLQLPSDNPRPTRQSFRGSQLVVTLPEELARRLIALSHEQGVTLFMTMLSSFFAFLSHYSGQDDIIVGSGVANRGSGITENLIGMLLNTVALRADLSSDPTVAGLLRQVRGVTLDAFVNQDVPFEHVLRATAPQRRAGMSPLYQVLFSFQDPPAVNLQFPDLSIVPDDTVGNGSAKADLNVVVINRRDGTDELSIVWEYSSDLFDELTAQGMLDSYLMMLDALTRDLSIRISQLPSMAPERRQELLDQAGFSTPYERDSSMVEVFESRAREQPSDPAIVSDNRELTYDELNKKANRVAHVLVRIGAEVGTRVAVVMERSPDAVVALLAILKAGSAYVALDPSLPDARLDALLRDAGPVAVCVTSDLSDRAVLAGVPLVRLDDESIDAEPETDPRRSVSPDDLASISYTSGTGGVPKGVEVPHRAIVRLVRSADYVSLGRSQTLLHMAPLAFDASTFEVWGALLNGGRLVIAPPGPLAPDQIARVIEHYGVTTAWMSAGLFHQVVDLAPEALRHLHQLLAGGDVLSPEHVALALAQLPPDGVLINGYGPTEGTTFTCCHRMPAGSVVDGPVPIGRPIANTRVYIIDTAGELVPAGVAGELLIGGDGVTRGYFGRPQLTAEKFVVDRFGPDPTSRLYRSGDRARWRADGTIEFLGRMDRQVKVRGFRVEPEAVELALVGHPSVREAVVVAQTTGTDDRRLVAYVTSRDGEVPIDDVRAFLRSQLAPYEVPSVFSVLSELPLMANGKVDYAALPGPSPASQAAPQNGSKGDPLELAMLRMWERVLKVGPISTADDFFDLGGHSLLAVELFALIEQETGVRLPLATIFEAPTVEQLAMVLRSNGWTSPERSLTALTSTGSRPPLFFVTAGDGNSVGFGPLARRLGSDQPFYALQPRGLDGHRLLDSQVKRMARRYLHEIRTVQASGPYLLGGRCFGTLVAFELTKLLERAGEEVTLLIALDSVGPFWEERILANGIRFDEVMNLALSFEPDAAPRDQIFTDVGKAQEFVDWLQEPVVGRPEQIVNRYVYSAYRARPDLQAAFPSLEGQSAGLLHWTWVGGRSEMGMNPQLIPEPTDLARRQPPSVDPRQRSLSRRLRSRAVDLLDVLTRGRVRALARRRQGRVLELASRMILEYRAGPCRAPVALMRSEEYRGDSQLARWYGIETGGVSEHYVEGSHQSMLREPDVRSLARCIESCVDRANER